MYSHCLFFFNHLVCVFLGMFMVEEILALGLQKNTDYLFCMNTLKVNSGNRGLNSASALCWAVHTTIGILPHVLPPRHLMFTLCRILLCSPPVQYFSDCKSKSKHILMCLDCTETIWTIESWSQKNTSCFFISQLQESERMSRTLIHTRCFKVRWKSWCHESFLTATNWPCYSEQASSACGRLQA